MTRRTLFVILAGLAGIVAFAAATYFYDHRQQQKAADKAAEQNSIMVRPHSPVLGPPQAPVTIVEFFDPACEACRAFYPYVKQTLAAFPNDVRLVIRYVPFHKDISVAGVQILEAARAQGRFEPVLDELLRLQPEWAGHEAPSATRAWEIAVAAGLELADARRHALAGTAEKLLEQDVADLTALGIQATPTFFINGKPLSNPDPSLLHEMVVREVEQARRTK